MRVLTPVALLMGCGFTPPEPPAERDCEKRDVFFQDTDGDGLGSDDHIKLACELTYGWAATGGDCDDTDASVTNECHQFDTAEVPEDTGSEDTGDGTDTGPTDPEDTGVDTGDSGDEDTGNSEDQEGTP